MAVSDLLRCPRCAGVLHLPSHLAGGATPRCLGCGFVPEQPAGVLDLAPHVPLYGAGAGLAQRAMNTPAYALMYETPVWRPLLTRLGSGAPAEQEMTDILLYAGVGKASAVVDLACGTGHYTRALARRFSEAEVLGIDISPGMLARAARLAERSGHNHLHFIRGDLYQLPLKDASVDRVNCCGALHLFPEMGPIWSEIRRVLRPGGLFTAMTITLAPGPLQRVQRRMMAERRATFFEVAALSEQLAEAGLGEFEYIHRRISIVFKAARVA